MSRALEDYRRAWRRVESVAASASRSAWKRPSPCAEWTAHQVAGHLIDGQRQVQALIEGATRIVGQSDPAALAELADGDPAAALHESARAVEVSLRNLSPEASVSTARGLLRVEQVLAIALIEPVIHAWDLAVATGQPETLDACMVATLLRGVEQVGNELVATGMYAPALPVPQGATETERLLAALGRRSR